MVGGVKVRTFYFGQLSQNLHENEKKIGCEMGVPNVPFGCAKEPFAKFVKFFISIVPMWNDHSNTLGLNNIFFINK